MQEKEGEKWRKRVEKAQKMCQLTAEELKAAGICAISEDGKSVMDEEVYAKAMAKAAELKYGTLLDLQKKLKLNQDKTVWIKICLVNRVNRFT